MSAESFPGFTYRRLHDHIHELVLYADSPSALRECFKQLNLIFLNAPVDQPLLLLSDIRESGVPPAGELWGLTRRLLDNYPLHPVICNAVLHNLDGRFYRPFLTVMQLLARMFNARIAFFAGDKHDAAAAWLLEQARQMQTTPF